MKEQLADERSACQDRVDRQTFKERQDWSLRQEAREGVLKQEISGWLQVMIYLKYTTLEREPVSII